MIDSGIDYTHPDLQGNIWVNHGEIPNNGIDDDKNGFIDDYYGWNFLSNSGDNMDNNYHGTHLSGAESPSPSVALHYGQLYRYLGNAVHASFIVAQTLSFAG